MLLMRLPLVGGKSALSGWQGFPRRVYPRRRIPSPPRPPCWPPMPRCAREETIYPRSSFGRSRTGESMLVSPFLRVGHLPHGSLQNPGDPGHRSSPLRAVVPGPSRVASPCPWPIIPRDVAKHGWQKRKEKSATPLSGVTSNPHGERCLHVSFEHMRSPPVWLQITQGPAEAVVATSGNGDGPIGFAAGEIRPREKNTQAESTGVHVFQSVKVLFLQNRQGRGGSGAKRKNVVRRCFSQQAACPW